MINKIITKEENEDNNLIKRVELYMMNNQRVSPLPSQLNFYESNLIILDENWLPT